MRRPGSPSATRTRTRRDSARSAALFRIPSSGYTAPHADLARTFIKGEPARGSIRSEGASGSGHGGQRWHRARHGARPRRGGGGGGGGPPPTRGEQGGGGRGAGTR